MADIYNWTRVANNSTAGNIKLNIDIGIASVTRTSNSNVRVVYGVRFIQSASTYTYNSIAAFCPKDSGNRYYAFNSGSGSRHTSSGTYYYANTSGSTTTNEVCPFTIDIPVSLTQTSASFEVGYGWNGYTPAQKGSSSMTVTFPTGATAPTGVYCNGTNLTETSVDLSGGYSSDGGASVTATGYQYRTETGGWTGCSANLTGLVPGTKYYFRYYATNSQGTSYSAETGFVTYSYPYCTSTPNFTIGNNVVINLYNPLNRNVEIQMYSYVGNVFINQTTISTNVNGNYTFPASNYITQLYSSIPASRSSQYNIDVWYGSNKAVAGPGIYSIVGNEVPTFSANNIIDVVDTLNVAITGDNTKFIKGHNTLTGKITPMSSNYYAQLDYYSLSATGQTTQTKNYSSSNVNFSFSNLTSNQFKINAVDKRELSTEAIKTITIIDYSNPTLTDINITREDGIGDHIYLNLQGRYTNWQNLAQNNAIQRFRYRYKAQGTSTWSSWTTITGYTSSNGTWTINKLLDDVFNNTKKYDMEVEVQDKLETVVFSGLVVSTANALVWKDLGNKRIGVGKKPNKTLDVAGDIDTDGALYVNGTRMIWYE